MGAITPNIFTDIHVEEVSYKKPTTEETIKKLTQNLNFLNTVLPLGMIMYFNVNQPNATLPDPDVWQVCDGSEITNNLSPLRSSPGNYRATPNLSSKYIRCASNASSNGEGSNSRSYNLAHNHNGVTSGMNVVGPRFIEHDEGDDVQRSLQMHTHTIETDLTSYSIDFPAWIKLVPYIKIT